MGFAYPSISLRISDVLTRDRVNTGDLCVHCDVQNRLCVYILDDTTHVNAMMANYDWTACKLSSISQKTQI